MRKLIATLVLAASPLLASAATITVHNTGVDVNDSLVGPGEATAWWTLSSSPAGSSVALGSTPFRFKHPAYAADTANSAWVSPGASGNAGVGGLYVYDLVVDLTGFDLGTVSIQGLFSSDNDGALWLNNEAAAVTTGFASFGGMHAFSLTSGFVAGLNVIHAMVNNGGDPSAFHVQFTGALGDLAPAPVPLPAPAALLLGALGALALRRRSV